MGANKGRSVAVIGGGIAGLAAAAAFARSGAAVTVYEQAKDLREVGAGLQITPNGAAVLAGLGLSAKADACALRAQALEPTDALTGRRIARFDLSRLKGEPYRFFHRADLQDLLASSARAAGVRILTGHLARTVSERGAVTFDNGTETRADLVLGADGLHSILRPELNPGGAPIYTGQAAWRSVVEMPDQPAVARVWMAPGRHVVTYPLPGGRLNIVAVEERQNWTAEGWAHPDSPANLQAAFADCAAPLRDILARIESVRLWGLFRHPVAARWWGQGVALLGDAAHPTLPFLAQGANLALEDAWVLARCCDAEPALDLALATYQTLRRPRVIRAIEAANANAVNYHLSGARRRAAHLALGLVGGVANSAFLRRYDWLYRHDVTA